MSMSVKKKVTAKVNFKDQNLEQSHFEFIIENAGLSKFRTLKLFIILTSNFKQMYNLDIIIPKANKSEEFAPLIQIAEKELENFEQEENNGVTEEEFKQFVKDVYQQTLIDIVNEGCSSDEDENQKQEQDDASQVSETTAQKEYSYNRKLNIVDNLGQFERVSTQTREQLLKGNKNSRLRIFQHPFCYLSVTQLTRDLLFKSFSSLEVYQLYSQNGQILDHFHEIPNNQKYAFLVDFETSTKEGEKLHKFITTFNPDVEDPVIKLNNLLENFPVSRTRELKLNAFRIREAFFDDDEDLKAGRKRRFKELQIRIKKRIRELYKGNPHAKIESSIPVLPQMPKMIASAVGKNRMLFKDVNKERAKNYNKERKDEQLKFNDIRLTPPETSRNISPDQFKGAYKTTLPKIDQSRHGHSVGANNSLNHHSGMLNNSQSVSTLLHTSKKTADIGKHDGNYDLDEMKDFFMKHYNNSNEYHEKLQSLNLRLREKQGNLTAKPGTTLNNTKSVPNLRSIKGNHTIGETLAQMGLQIPNQKTFKMNSNLNSANSQTSVSTKASIIQMNKKRPVELMSLNQQLVTKNKRQISNFLYNKSKFIRNLILSNTYLSGYLSQFSYNFDDIEQIFRFHYLMIKSQEENIDIGKVQVGVHHLDSINENDFSNYINKFVQSEQLIDFKTLLANFKQLRKINKNILEIILKILQVKLMEVDSKNENQPRMKVVDLEGYLKLRYFFIDKKASKEENIQLIGNVS
ncbi:UNKNOWN [Stylonychia lemnae]|uniref:Uncharacterized protein n=1 Tax=Stylonychia lemnae TaxID=5949 RepID=A0A078A840_STYLE|nr:UNKNOWN [Stylonychia lemnae]|eukprot:CDW78036.1 UNKNOWN [Stylonychia lemnae]